MGTEDSTVRSARTRLRIPAGTKTLKVHKPTGSHTLAGAKGHLQLWGPSTTKITSAFRMIGKCSCLW